MVEIFKTNICCEQRAKEILEELNSRLPDHHLNVDLEDCDRVLRAESHQIDVAQIISILEHKGIRSMLID